MKKSEFKLNNKQAARVSNLLDKKKLVESALTNYLQACADLLEVPEGYIYDLESSTFKPENDNTQNKK
jgi:hypothetical protein